MTRITLFPSYKLTSHNVFEASLQYMKSLEKYILHDSYIHVCILKKLNYVMHERSDYELRVRLFEYKIFEVSL